MSYATERAERLAEESFKIADKSEKELKALFLQTQKDMDKEMSAFYGKFGVVEQSPVFETLPDGTQVIKGYTSKTVLPPDKVLPKRGKSISHLEVMQKELKSLLESHTKEQLLVTTNTLKRVAEFAYYDAMFNLYSDIGMGSSFKLLTSSTINALIKNPVNGADFVERTMINNGMLANRVNQTLRSGIIQGLGISDMTKMLHSKVNIGFNDAKRIIQTETTNTMNQSALESYKASGVVEKYQYLATLDNRTSEVCTALDGQVFPLDKATTGVNYPPMHPNCYDSQTEVFTDKGWKLFDDLDGSEQMFSYDIETKENGFLKPINYIKWFNEGEMIRFSNRSFDMMVTPQHNMICEYAKADGSHRERFVEANRMPKWNNKIPRGIKWEGERPESVMLGDYEIEPELYCKFMGYYLSEGSSTKIKDQNGYRVKIAQEKHLEKMYNDIKDLPFNVTKTAVAINIYDYSVGKHLKKYGYSFEKYVPEEIQRMTPELITIFLDAYILGDGNVKENNKYKGFDFGESKTIFTSSKRMADDLGLLILKAGGRPSFNLQPTKGKAVQHRNGVYVTNHDTWCVSWCKRVYTYTETLKTEIVNNYNDYVYCVELPKWNTLLVRRNGKVAWSGNCRSTTVAYFENVTNLFTRMARDEEGRNFTVPADMTAKDFKAIYVDKEITRSEWDKSR